MNIRTPGEESVWEMVRAVADSQPDAIAITDGLDRVTFAGLIAEAERIGSALRGLGVTPGSVVAICAERSVRQVVTALGVFAAGAAIAPFDVRAAAATTRRSVERLRPALAVADEEGRAVLPDAVALDDLGRPGGSDVGAGPSNQAPGTLAYVLHTSGSLGRPKPVLIPHSAVANRFAWGQTRYPLGPDDVVAYYGSLVFDCTFWVVFAPLCFGSTLLVAPPGIEAEPEKLADLVVRHDVTVMHFVPSLLREFLAGGGGPGLAGLRNVLIAGERLTGDLVGEVFAASSGQVFNQYGPTEACIDILTWPLRPGDTDADAVPIGRPIDGVSAHVLDDRGEPVPDGVPGELHVGGVCLAWGYGASGGATAAAFRPDPFSGVPGARLYRTGDLVSRRPDGVMEFLGRVDHQVKIRGVRIEPSDVEHALVQHPGIAQAAVVAVPGVGERMSLAAHVVPLSEPPKAADLRRFLADHVLSAAVPGTFAFHTDLPRLASGKIDRRELLRLSAEEEAATRPTAQEAEPHEPPRTASERKIAEIWESLFGVTGLGRSADFVALGGQSLLAMRMIARVRAAFDVRIPARSIFDATTVRAFALVVDDAVWSAGQSRSEPGASAVTPSAGPVPLGPDRAGTP
ncbi:non-ribosomal peptide synthetase [Actinoplanes sp. NPDC051470]|uniref:non-ribosomal peptide synthetase n=1 Tax=unclassified Actinoplanes TaxID=2626549 RepID=UPI003445ADA3